MVNMTTSTTHNQQKDASWILQTSIPSLKKGGGGRQGDRGGGGGGGGLLLSTESLPQSHGTCLPLLDGPLPFTRASDQSPHPVLQPCICTSSDLLLLLLAEAFQVVVDGLQEVVLVRVDGLQR